MSVINQMLQELDRRNAMASPAGPVPNPPRAEERVGRHEWFWRVLAALMIVALGWTGWVAYNLRPQSVATPSAFTAAQEARSRSTTSTQGKLSQPAQAPAPGSEPALVLAPTLSPVPVQPPPAAPVPSPVAEAPPAPAIPRVPVPEKKSLAADSPKPSQRPRASLAPLDLPPARVIPAPVRRVERQDRVVSPSERAEAEFRRAVGLLKQGRSAEAEEGFAAALSHDVRHRAARQALVVLELERGRLQNARRLLEQGLELDPAQPDFAAALARIHLETNDFAGALSALQRAAGSAGDHAEFHYLRGTALQRMGRHKEATDAYQTSLQSHSSNPQAWIGLGISLEALKHRPEAADAFRRALAAGPENPELKSFAEQRIRALR